MVSKRKSSDKPAEPIAPDDIDRLLDEALEESFPASDPVSIDPPEQKSSRKDAAVPRAEESA